MRPSNDFWYIRFPDGRVLRAAGSGVVRQQLAAGRLPPGTRLRRSPEEDWRAVERFAEFADLSAQSGHNGGDPAAGPPATIASRLDPAQLRLIGVRAFLDELLAALDGTAVACKLQAAGLAGLLLGALLGLARLPLFTFTLEPPGWGWALAGGAVVVLAWLTGVLSRTSYVEVSRLRPSRWRDGLQGIGTLSARLAVAFALVGGLVAGLVAVLRWLPGLALLYAENTGEPLWQVAARALAVTAVLGEALLWLVLPMLLPVGALLVVEDCSVLAGLWQWLKLVRQGPGRLLVAEGMALGIALVLALPLLVLLAVLHTWTPDPVVALAVELTRAVVAGLALALPLAYLLVANVFIYLNLRYETPRR
jgi:hypothetical protein